MKQLNQRLCKHAVRPSPYSHQTEGGKEAAVRPNSLYYLYWGKKNWEPVYGASGSAVLLSPAAAEAVTAVPAAEAAAAGLEAAPWRAGTGLNPASFRPAGGPGTILRDRLLVRENSPK